jgi:hypothetical protein
MLMPVFIVVFIFVASLIAWVVSPTVIFVLAVPATLLRAFFGKRTYKQDVATLHGRIRAEWFTRKKLRDFSVIAALISGLLLFIGYGPPRF